MTVCPPLSFRDPPATKGSPEKSARMAKRWRLAKGWNPAGGGEELVLGWGCGEGLG